MSKRANGEGSFHKRDNGTWMARVSYVDPTTGKRKRVAYYGKTKAEARAKLKAGQDRLAVGAPPKDSTVTVAEWLAHWRESTLEASDRKATTKSLYAALSTKHLEPAPFGLTRLDRLMPTDVERLVVDLRDRKLSDSTN